MAAAAATPGDATPAERRSAEDPAVFRIRFLNFNMANSKRFVKTSDLPGHLGPGTFDAVMQAPFADGKPLDFAFFSLVETRCDLKQWAVGFNAVGKDTGRQQNRWRQLDSVVTLDAASASAESSENAMRDIGEGLAVAYNGNLGTLLGFSSRSFVAEEGVLHGRLPEKTVLGVPVPNPKKAFTGSGVTALRERHPEEFRFLFCAAHFPIESISEMFEQPSISGSQILQGAKIALARVLRKILRRASKRGMLDNSSILMLQGDLNSRTVVVDNGTEVVATDLLQEVMRDRSLQDAIQQGLDIPSGGWAEIVDVPPTGLPVTYKYHDELGAAYAQAEEAFQVGDAIEGLREDASWTPGKIEGVLGGNKYMVEWHDGDSEGRMQPKKNIRRPRAPKSIDAGGDPPPAVTIGDIIDASKGREIAIRGGDDGEAYKRIMSGVPKERLEGWGLVFKESGFRAFRFPASADRVIYWAPAGLGERVVWEMPEGGYNVLHSQAGSDHRPVAVEAILRIDPPVEGAGAAMSFQLADDPLQAELSVSNVLHEVHADDDKDSDNE